MHFALQLYSNISKCIKLDKLTFEYDTMFVFGVKIYIWGFGYFWWYNFFVNVCLENGFFRSRFQQSAKCKMTAQTMRTNNVLSENSTL